MSSPTLNVNRHKYQRLNANAWKCDTLGDADELVAYLKEKYPPGDYADIKVFASGVYYVFYLEPVKGP